ncbi:spore coat protein U domain-containing protein [Citrobacter sedlakii]|uniref:spore coat protein U domain-containing protein n=1 Tax=Citrobacter sedlakii TaxID=67826 RepID=UPI0022B4C1B8|nr:spore coat protein U domain-containing protein [Citrobacter sedlakii]MCZ4677087.1 spore coat protein U domain-containing protein [Citrobacter sedlakii]MDR5007143.1 spore coat protein U domain-containing protein [Citrobacter sedlakii]
MKKRRFIDMLLLSVALIGHIRPATGGYWLLGHNASQTSFNFTFTYPSDRIIQIDVTGSSAGSTFVYAASCSNAGAVYDDIYGMSLPKKLTLSKNGVTVELPLQSVTSPAYSSANNYVFGTKQSQYNYHFVCKSTGVNPDTTPVYVGPYRAILRTELPLTLTEGIWTGRVVATTAMGQKTRNESDNLIWQSIAERADMTGSGSFSVPVSIDVPEPPASCTVSGENVNFGEITPAEVSGRNKRTKLVVNCNKNASGTMRLSGGLNYEGNYMNLQLSSGAGARLSITGGKGTGAELKEDFSQGVNDYSLYTELYLTDGNMEYGAFSKSVIVSVLLN